ncbi:uracil-xanthine permease family protein [Hutsoniella sourekii]
MSNRSNIPDFIQVTADEKLPALQAGLLGLAHVLVMNVFVVAVLLAGILNLGEVQTSQLIQSSFMGAGVATLLQVFFGIRMPVAQGASFVPLGAMVGIYQATGSFDAVMGAMLVASIVLFLLGLSGFYRKVTQVLIPNLVSGLIVMVIGLSLMPTAFMNNIFIESGSLTMPQNILLASVTIITLMVASLIGKYVPRLARPMAYCSVLLALGVGTGLAQLMGGVNWQAFQQAPWVTLPSMAFVNYHLAFDPSSIITMLLIFLVLLAETTGSWYAIASVSGEELDQERMNRGVILEGIENIINSLLGASPTASYSSNAGIIAMTGIASRSVFVGAGIIFIMLGFFGKLASLISIIPTAVIGGIFAMVSFQIFLAGFNLVHPLLSSERNQYIVGIVVLVTLGSVLLPSEVSALAPNLIQYFLASPIAVGALVGIVLNKCLPETE